MRQGGGLGNHENLRLPQQEAQCDLPGGGLMGRGYFRQCPPLLRARIEGNRRLTERRVGDHGRALSRAPGQHRMLDCAFLQVIQHLIAGRMSRSRDGRDLVKILDVEIAHAPRQNLAVAQQCVEAGDGVLQGRSAAPVKQVAIQPVGAQPRERLFAGRHGAALRGVARQHLRHQENLVAPALDRRADHRFRGSGPIHLGGIDMRQTEVEAAAQGGDGGIRPVLDFPRSLADRRDAAPGRAEGTRCMRHEGVARL